MTHVVDALAGTPAERFETTARRHAAMPFAQQTLAKRLEAFVRFNLTPFDPGHDCDRWDRAMRFPRPDNPTLSVDDAIWQDTNRSQMRWHAKRPAPPMDLKIASPA